MIGMRENEDRSRALGYNPFRVKLIALTISGLYAGAAGAVYAMLFGYVGASFASVQYSILPSHYVLLGGARTVLGPSFLGALLMFFLIDIAAAYTSTHLFVLGGALLVLVLFLPKGILGAIRAKGAKWLP